MELVHRSPRSEHLVGSTGCVQREAGFTRFSPGVTSLRHTQSMNPATSTAEARSPDQSHLGPEVNRKDGWCVAAMRAVAPRMNTGISLVRWFKMQSGRIWRDEALRWPRAIVFLPRVH